MSPALAAPPRAARDPGPRPGRRRDAAATREALLAAGAELFAERGYEGVPVAAIAAAAGVTKAMINYHFGGKRGLYLAIVRGTFSEIVARLAPLAEASRPAPELLRELVAALAELVTRRHPHFPAMMLREIVSGGRRLDADTLAQPVAILATVRRILERGVKEGAFRPVDPLLTHLTLVGSLVFYFATARFRERVLRDGGLRPPDAAAYVGHIQDLIAHGLAAGRAGSAPGRPAGSRPPRRHGARRAGGAHP